MRAAPDWIALIKRAFDEHPEVDFVGGKVLPQWEREPPAWLTRKHWSPLAITDYGEEQFYVDTEKQLCLVGANLSFRREVFEQTGLFKPDLQRVKDGVGSMEDHEFLLRVWATGRRGLYVSGIVMSAEVQEERMTKHKIATVLAQRFAELAPLLPPKRKCTESEDYRMSIFDALACGAAYFGPITHKLPAAPQPLTLSRAATGFESLGWRRRFLFRQRGRSSP